MTRMGKCAQCLWMSVLVDLCCLSAECLQSWLGVDISIKEYSDDDNDNFAVSVSVIL